MKYIDGQVKNHALERWNIVVIGVKNAERTLPLGLSDDSPLISRSKLTRSSTKNRAVIGTLMSKPDRVADLVPAADVRRETLDTELQRLRDDDGRGLLVLYPIDRDSQPKKGANYRQALEAADHLIGVALCFPTAKPDTEPVSTIQVDMQQPLGPEEITEYQDTEGSQDEVNLGDG